MEFLGDSILGFLVSKKLYEVFPNEAEGDLAKRKSAIVCKSTLAEVARNVGLDEYIILGNGEDKGGGRDNDANLENAFEALVAAIYLDDGIVAVDKLIDLVLSDKIRLMKEPPKDPKSTLQEQLQAAGREIPAYDVISIEGPSHQPDIKVSLKLDDGLEVRASSNSRKKAERIAAKEMLEILDGS